jgi:hypothetical protein
MLNLISEVSVFKDTFLLSSDVYVMVSSASVLIIPATRAGQKYLVRRLE